MNFWNIRRLWNRVRREDWWASPGCTVKNEGQPDGEVERVVRPWRLQTKIWQRLGIGSLRYAAHGGVELSALGNGKKQQACYNNRLQVKAMRVGDADTAQCAADGADWLRLSFDYGTTNNNGNVRSQTIEARKDAGGFTSILQSYAHDGVNRLTQMTETGGAASWILNVGYDRYGNQWQGSPTESLSTLTPRNQFQVDAATNRLVKYWNDGAVAAGAYDGDGNLVNYTGIGASIFDGENRIVSVTGTGGTTAFEYDGNGRRVRKTATGTSTLFVYDASGKLAAEYNGQTAAAGRFYVSGDHLGSTRLTMDASGGRVSCADYLPFGEEIQTGTAAAMRSGVGCFSGGAPLRQKFTGKERDAETGLDYFGARYMASAQGRFTSPDPGNAGAHPEHPQSWNGYAYALNNPLKFVDPDGESATLAGALIGGVVGGAVAAYRGQDISTGVLKGVIAGAVAGSLIDTGGASLGVLALSGAAGGVTGGALDRAFAGQQTTLSDVGRDAAVGAVAGAVLGQAGKVIGARVGEAMLASDAIGARDAVAGAAGKGTATVIGAYDAQIGQIAVGRSGAGLNPLNPQVAGAAERAGGLGARNPGVRGAVGNCAECNAANQLTNQGSKVGNVRFTPAVRPRTGEVIPKCQNCEVMFPNQ